MKDFLKNTLLAILVICCLLNVVNLIELVIENYTLIPKVEKAAELVSEDLTSKEEIYQALASFYSARIWK